MEKTNEVKVEKTVGDGVGFERIRRITGYLVVKSFYCTN